jgi:hypothetical protein
MSLQSAENYKDFMVTFQENKKYNPATRSIMARCSSEYAAKMLIAQQFGSIKQGKDIKTMLLPEVSESKIKILNVKEVKI